MDERKLARTIDSRVWVEEFRKELDRTGCPVNLAEEFLEPWFRGAIEAGYNRRDDEVMACLV
jgi:hypothetical protein